MLESNKVYQGDCLELMSHLDDKSIDMILCDLPYGMTQCKWDSIIPLDQLWNHYKRIIKPNGVVVLTGSQPFTSQLVMSNPRWFKYEIIWEKDNCTNYMNAKHIIMKVHENILVFYKNKPIYNPQMIYKGLYVRSNKGGREDSGVYKEILRTDYNSSYRYPRSVQRINSEKGLHPTQKPVKLFEWLIKTYTNEGMTVLDNCAGSGTTAIACLNTNRNYILMEQDASYVNICNERIEKHNDVIEKPVKIKRIFPLNQLDIFHLINKERSIECLKY